jgi:RNase P/RNase MRP subunit p29
LPAFVALVPFELFGHDAECAVADLDPDLVGVRGEVVVPAWVTCRAS